MPILTYVQLSDQLTQLNLDKVVLEGQICNLEASLTEHHKKLAKTKEDILMVIGAISNNPEEPGNLKEAKISEFEKRSDPVLVSPKVEDLKSPDPVLVSPKVEDSKKKEELMTEKKERKEDELPENF